MTRPIKYLGLAALWLALTAAGFLLVRHFGPDVSANLREPAAINVHNIDVALADLDDQPRRLDSWGDGPMLINFWATWCPPCRREIPMLMDLQDRYRARGLTVVGIAIDETDPVKQYAQETGFNYPILIGEADGVKLATALGADIMALPITVFVDRDGNVSRQHLGEIHLQDAEMALADILPD